jgi:hypothetical protein
MADLQGLLEEGSTARLCPAGQAMIRRVAPLACLLIVASGCATTSPETHTPTGKIGGGMPIATSTTPSEPGKDLFLTHRPGDGRPLRLGETAAYDACTVLPLRAMREVGIELDPYYQVRQDFMERDASGDPSLARMNLEGLSNCTWPGVDDQHVILQIYQPPYSHDRDRTSRLEFLDRKGAKAESVRGMTSYTVHGGNNDPHQWQVSLFADDYWALLLMKTKHDTYRAGSAQDVVNKLVDGIASNLERGPTGPSTFSYGGPYADFPDPCTLFTRDDFRQTYGVDDVGRVSRGRTGGDQLLTGDHGERARYIRITCARKALGATFADDNAPGLELELQVFPDPGQAALMEFAVCDPTSSATKVFGPPLPIPTKIGDGRTCMPNEGRPNRRLVFRVGRTVAYLHNWLYTDAADLSTLATKLTPIAHTIASRL